MLVFKQLYRVVTARPASTLANLCVLIFSVSLIPQLSAQALTHNLPTPLSPELPFAIGELEFSDKTLSPYDHRLVDPLFLQARQLQEMGEHSDALRLFKESIHILRINKGLYDEAQIDILDYMIESEIALRNWEMVDRHYGYMEHLYRRLYPMNDMRLEKGLQKIVSWHVSALNVNIDGRRIEHLQQANKLFKLRLQAAQLTLTADDPKLAFLSRNIAICERQLYLASDLNREMQKRQRIMRQSTLLADRD